MTVMGLLMAIYNLHPYYQRTGPQNFRNLWKPVFNAGCALWLLAGLPYVLITSRRFGGVRMDLTDGAVHYLLLLRGIWYWVFEGCRWPRHIWSNPRMRITVLSLGVKAFFTPLMTCFMVEHYETLVSMWYRKKGIPTLTPDQINAFSAGGISNMLEAWWTYVADVGPRLLPSFQGMLDTLNVSSWTRADIDWSCNFYYQGLFFVDCIWALTGYAGESRWLGNKTKSVEPTGFGWMVALMCYPPFNDLSGTYFPLGRNSQHQWFSGNPDFVLGCRILMLAAFTVYVWATLAFGPTFSNLTNRGIVTRGPYAFIRHPAYACKNFAWWMEYLPYFGKAADFLPLLVWNLIYALRGWTEERHLSQDPAYLEYKKRVPWKAIPGVW
jgi:protein-S-isoprenylcysteine O-methyltransferase Ste14